MKFENKTILITGASTGIGKAIAQQLFQTSCNLVLIARRNELIQEYVKNDKNRLAEVKIIKCDVSLKDQVESTYQKIIDVFGKVDIAILNAGVDNKVTPETFSSEKAEKTININFLAVTYWIEQLLPGMMRRKSGIIAPVSSLADNRGYSGSGFYCASKAALSIFSEGLAVDLKKYDIKVINIKPGFVKTPMTDKNKFKMHFMVSAKKAANYIVRGIEKEKSIIQFPLPTVLGSKIIGSFPSWFYQFFASKKQIDV